MAKTIACCWWFIFREPDRIHLEVQWNVVGRVNQVYLVSDGSFGDDIDPAVSQGWSYNFTILDVYHYLIILFWLISFFVVSRGMYLFTN